MAGSKNTAPSIALTLSYAVLGITISATFAVGVRVWGLYNELKEEQQKNLLAVARFQSQAVEEYLERLKNIAITVTSSDKVIPAKPEKLIPKTTKTSENERTKNLNLSKLEELFKTYPELAGIRRYNQNNKQIQKIGLSGLDEIPAHQEGLSWIENQAYLTVEVPFLDKNSQPKGKSLVLFKLDRLEDILKKQAGDNTIKTALFSLESRRLIFLPKQTTLPKNSPLAVALQKIDTQRKDLRSIDKPLNRIIYSPIKDSKWAVVVWRESGENGSLLSEKDFGSHLLILGTGTAIVIGLGGITSLIFWKRFNQSQEKLDLILNVGDWLPAFSSENSELDSEAPRENAQREESFSSTIKDSHNLTKKAPQTTNSTLISAEKNNDQPVQTQVWRSDILSVGGEIFGFWDWNFQSNEIYYSAAWKTCIGYTENEIGNHPDEWFKRVHPDDVERLKAELSVHFAGLTPYFRNEHRILHKDGSYRWMLARGVAVRDSNGKAHAIGGSISDISEKKAAEEENRRLAAFPRNDPNPVLAADKNGNLIYLNPAAKKILKKLGINDPIQFLPANHRFIVDNCLSSLASERHIEHHIKDSIFSWSYHPIPSLGVIHLYATDITERHWAQEQLEQAAWHDGLTGLPNRTLFIQRVEQALKAAKKRSNGLFALLFLDLDRFKVVNDSLGHSLGDQFLIAVARRIGGCLRSGDVVARLGGDEFTILLSSIDSIDEATAFAERVQQELVLPLNLNGHQVFTTASIGIAVAAYGEKVAEAGGGTTPHSEWGRPYHQPEDLLRDADIAMYRAKAEGKARYVVFTQTMQERAIALLRLENDLRRAISEGGLAGNLELNLKLLTSSFVLHYQPVVALDTGRIAGFEALVRWIHPQRGMISPAEFIPVAEETGLIIPLGSWVLYEACRQLKAWQEKFRGGKHLTMSVNLSGRQLSQTDLLYQIDEILQTTGIDPCYLKLEITESVLMDNAASSISVLEELRARNIGLCIDDFGTGYSSLSYLHRFPINTLKIDRSFVKEMGGDDENSEIVRAIVMLAHNLGMYVVAEGVETEKHLVQLWALQCEYGQGYFFSKPVPAADAEALVAEAPQW